MITLAQAAQQLGVTADNLRMAIRHGTLVATKYGPIWLVEEAEVDRYRRLHSRAGRRAERVASAEPRRGRGRPRKVDPAPGQD